MIASSECLIDGESRTRTDMPGQAAVSKTAVFTEFHHLPRYNRENGMRPRSPMVVL